MDKYTRLEINSTAARILERLNSLDELAASVDKSEYESADFFRAGFDTLQTNEKEELLTDLMKWAKSRQLSYESYDSTMLKNIEDFQAFFVDSLSHDLSYLSRQMDKWDGNLKSILKSIDMFHHQFQEIWGNLPHGSTGEKFSHLQLEQSLRNKWNLDEMSMEDRLKYYEEQQRHLIDIMKQMQAFMESAASELDDARRLQKETSAKLAEVMHNLEQVKMSDAAKEELLSNFRAKEQQREGRMAGRTIATQEVFEVDARLGGGKDGSDAEMARRKGKNSGDLDETGSQGKSRSAEEKKLQKRIEAQEKREQELTDKVRELERLLERQRQQERERQRETEGKLRQELERKLQEEFERKLQQELERKLQQELELRLEQERKRWDAENRTGRDGSRDDSDQAHFKLGQKRMDSKSLVDIEPNIDLAELHKSKAADQAKSNNRGSFRDLKIERLASTDINLLKKDQQQAKQIITGRDARHARERYGGVVCADTEVVTQSAMLYEVPQADTGEQETQTEMSLIGVDVQIGPRTPQPKEPSSERKPFVTPNRFRHSLNLRDVKELAREPDDEPEPPAQIREPESEQEEMRHTIGGTAEKRSPRTSKSHRTLGEQTRGMPYMTLPLGGKQSTPRSQRIGMWERKQSPKVKPYTPLVSVRSIQYRPKDHSPIVDELIHLNLPRPFTGKIQNKEDVKEYPDIDMRDDD